MEFTIEEHGLFVEVTHEESWNNDETHIDYWSITVSKVDEHDDIGDTVFEDSGHDDPDFFVDDEESITEWLSKKGVLGAEAHQQQLQNERRGLMQELQTAEEGLLVAKATLTSQLANINATAIADLVTEWCDASNIWDTKSQLGALRGTIDSVKHYTLRIAHLRTQIDQRDKALAAYVPQHVRAITDLLTGS